MIIAKRISSHLSICLMDMGIYSFTQGSACKFKKRSFNHNSRAASHSQGPAFLCEGGTVQTKQTHSRGNHQLESAAQRYSIIS